MNEKLNRKMDEQLASRVAELDAHNDETGDGKLDAADLKAQLNRIVAFLLGSLLLNDRAGSRLNDGDGDHVAVLVKNLGHTHFFADDCLHVYFLLLGYWSA